MPVSTSRRFSPTSTRTVRIELPYVDFMEVRTRLTVSMIDEKWQIQPIAATYNRQNTRKSLLMGRMPLAVD